VQPGLVLDNLNRHLKSDGWWYPVDVSTASRATLGGMAANNSCGSRSIRYGKMQDNVRALTAMTVDGTTRRFEYADTTQALDADMRALALKEQNEITTRFPKVQRRVGGYNIDALLGDAPHIGHLLVGSEGTLALTKSIDLKLSPVARDKNIGRVSFPHILRRNGRRPTYRKIGTCCR
jgi:FAD/FMN-containing dehydrogenase